MPVIFDGVVAVMLIVAVLVYRAWMIYSFRKQHATPAPAPRRWGYVKMLFAFSKWKYEDFY